MPRSLSLYIPPIALSLSFSRIIYDAGWCKDDRASTSLWSMQILTYSSARHVISEFLFVTVFHSEKHSIRIYLVSIEYWNYVNSCD